MTIEDLPSAADFEGLASCDFIPPSKEIYRIGEKRFNNHLHNNYNYYCVVALES